MNKRILLTSILSVLFGVTIGYADSIITSKGYVDTQIGTTQAQIPAANTNRMPGSTVMTYTTTGNGVIGERGIYDNWYDYTAATDEDKLITASALEWEFRLLPRTSTTKLTCANDPDCTLWTITNQSAYGAAGTANGIPMPEIFVWDVPYDVRPGETIIETISVLPYDYFESVGAHTDALTDGVLAITDNGGCFATHPNGIAKGDVVPNNTLAGGSPGTHCYCPKFDGTGWVYLGQSDDYFSAANNICSCTGACMLEVTANEDGTITNSAFFLKLLGL